MELQTRLNEIVAKWNLLNHPFYQAWSAGMLPVESLRAYAQGYSAFIRELPFGWQSQNDAETAHEEEHIELWEQFAHALEIRIGEAERPAVRQLIHTARQLFADPVTALGALYAFEV